MPDLKILIADKLEEAGLEILRRSAQVTDCSGISAEELRQVIAGHQALVVRSRTRVTAELLDYAHDLKVIGRAGVGLDNIDLQAAQKHRVKVVNTPTATTQAVVELTIGLLFALARSIPHLDAAMKQGQWLKTETMGIEISGKTLGVIGLGSIGAAVARCAISLGLQVLGYDPYLTPDEISRRGASPVVLPDLYARSDFITLHVPLSQETRGLIDRQALQMVKPGACLICTSRGGIIDEKALLEALDSGRLAGAALDVFASEPPGASEMVRHPRLVATPHIGAQTHEAQQRAAEQVARLVLKALQA